MSVMHDAPTTPTTSPHIGLASPNGHNPGPLTPLDIQQILQDPPPTHQWLWDGYVERGTLTILHGDGGTGKSILAGHLARATATGGTCLGRSTTPGSVLIIDAENPLDEIARRMHALDYKNTAYGAITYYRATDPIFQGAAGDMTILAPIITAHRSSLVILDSQRGLWEGDEREANEIRPLYRRVQALAETLDTAIIIIHHDRRSGNFSGSSDIHNSADTRLWLERPDPDKPERILHHAKARSSAELQPAAYTFTFDEAAGLFMFSQPRDPITDADRIRQALTDNWQIATQIAERAGIRRADAMPTLWELVRSREAQFAEGPEGRKPNAKCFRSMNHPMTLSQTRDRQGQADRIVPSAACPPTFTPPLGGEVGTGWNADPVPPPDRVPLDDDFPF